jgi:Asp-tRNA(Asn)/Glu-tRNA(Gln) amidotransferase A subunit family amidase
VPAGFAPSSNLPVGLQLMADEFQEQTMLDAAALFESVAGVQQRSPDL